MKQLFRFIIILISACANAQVNGVVKDADGKPIPYATIWIDGEERGLSADEHGKFSIQAGDMNKTLVFSMLGYVEKKIAPKEAQEVVLEIKPYELDEIVLDHTAARKDKEKFKAGGFSEKDVLVTILPSKPYIGARFFYPSEYTKEHPYIKDVTFFAGSTVKNARIRLHFFEVGPDGKPGKDLASDTIIATIKKTGKLKEIKINLEKFDIRFPEAGLFVGLEWIIIPAHTLQYNKDKAFPEPDKSYTFQPGIGAARIDGKADWSYHKEKWELNKNTNKNRAMTFGAPAINLTLTD